MTYNPPRKDLKDVNQAISADRVEQTMRVLDSGQLDALIEDMMPESKPAVPERFADVKPFDHEAWKATSFEHQ